jgi:peroxiredoxin
MILLFLSHFCLADFFSPNKTLVSDIQSITGTLLNEKPFLLRLNPPSRITVILFLSSQCPCSCSHHQKIAQLKKDFSAFDFVGIITNIKTDKEQIKKIFSEANLGFELIFDTHLQLANAFGAVKTPHAFVIDTKRNLLFQGGVDDSSMAENAQKQWLREALTEINQGKAVSYPFHKTLGCIIDRES